MSLASHSSARIETFGGFVASPSQFLSSLPAAGRYFVLLVGIVSPSGLGPDKLLPFTFPPFLDFFCCHYDSF